MQWRSVRWISGGSALALIVAGSWIASTSAAEFKPDEASRSAAAAILKATGVQGGFVVHLNCGDGRLTAALRASDSYQVQGLVIDAKDLSAAREHDA